MARRLPAPAEGVPRRQNRFEARARAARQPRPGLRGGGAGQRRARAGACCLAVAIVIASMDACMCGRVDR